MEVSLYTNRRFHPLNFGVYKESPKFVDPPGSTGDDPPDPAANQADSPDKPPEPVDSLRKK